MSEYLPENVSDRIIVDPVGPGLPGLIAEGARLLVLNTSGMKLEVGCKWVDDEYRLGDPDFSGTLYITANTEYGTRESYTIHGYLSSIVALVGHKGSLIRVSIVGPVWGTDLVWGITLSRFTKVDQRYKELEKDSKAKEE